MRALNDLLDLLAALRDPERGDPWHRAQDFTSISPCTIEEAYEVADAIDRRDMGDLCRELGDLLFQVIYHARLAEEKGLFTFADVLAALDRKLRTREPLDAAVAGTMTGHVRRRERGKMQERSAASGNGMHAGLLDHIPLGQPALARAQKLQVRAATAGFDWKEAGAVLKKLAEEINELEAEMQGPPGQPAIRHELGDVLFACVNLARHLGVDAETALRLANHRFEQRFRYIEHRLRERNLAPHQVTLEELEQLWQEAKRQPP